VPSFFAEMGARLHDLEAGLKDVDVVVDVTFAKRSAMKGRFYCRAESESIDCSLTEETLACGRVLMQSSAFSRSI